MQACGTKGQERAMHTTTAGRTQETPMNRQQILDLYQWAPGICFRHPAKGEIDTTRVSTLRPRGGGQEEVRACRECVLDMEAARQEGAEEAGRPYFPGMLGTDA
jgi:hypothetical protein